MYLYDVLHLYVCAYGGRFEVGRPRKTSETLGVKTSQFEMKIP